MTVTKMAKFDIGSIVDDVKKNFKGKEKLASKVGSVGDLLELTDSDFIVLPSFWQDATLTKGIPFGRLTTFAGTPDSGKTSIAIQAIKAALEQGVGVIYCETEQKTTNKDFTDWGVDPTQIALISSNIAEEMYELVFQTWDSFREKYPDIPLLVVIDSIGNLISLRDQDLDMIEQSQKPGGQGKANRLGLSKLMARMGSEEAKTAIILISYTYDNMGSPGKTTAGGTALHFFSSLMYQTSRKAWLFKTVKGEKVKIGAEVIFSQQKNHINKSAPGDYKISYKITKDGFEFVGAKDDD
jgi:RecA/RadA recombinase